LPIIGSLDVPHPDNVPFSVYICASAKRIVVSAFSHCPLTTTLPFVLS
jgi:hypothetical protein